MPVSNVYKFQAQEGRLEKWANMYHYLIIKYGWIEASRWLVNKVPSQLVPQVQTMVNNRLNMEEMINGQ